MSKNTPSPSHRQLDAAKSAHRLREELLSNGHRPIVDKANLFERLADLANRWISSTWGLVFATLIFVGWLAAGPYFGWERSWYYVDAMMAFATFIFVFLLQRAQRKDSAAIHTKLNELLAAVERASPRLINLEDQSEEEVDALHDKFQELQEMEPGSRSIEDCDPDGEKEPAAAVRQ